MEGNKSSKVIALIGLVAGVVGISLGFAAFSNTLTIRASADVTPDQSEFDVNFSNLEASTPTAAADLTVAPSLTHAQSETTVEASGFTAETAQIVNDAKTPGQGGTASITNLGAHFTAPGQTVTYTFWVRNDGRYIAHLNGIDFANTTVNEVTAEKVCTARTTGLATGTTAATQSLVNAACEKISINVAVDGVTYSGDTANGIADTTGKSIALNGAKPVVVTIAYDATGDVRADGVFDVAFGDITLTYGSVD